MVREGFSPSLVDEFCLKTFSGNLALARALGDFEFKKNLTLPAEKQIITADPDVMEHQLTDEDEFLILACDGQHPSLLHILRTHHVVGQVSGIA